MPTFSHNANIIKKSKGSCNESLNTWLFEAMTTFYLLLLICPIRLEPILYAPLFYGN